MPRDVSGNYTLPAGNPVVDGTIIDVAWANPTMSDIATQLNNVITRDGVLGATNPIKFASGAAAAPSITFTADPALGMYRVGSGSLGLAAAGALVASFASAGVGLFQNLGIGSPSNASFLAPLDVTTNSSTVGVILRGRSADGTSMLQFAANNGTTIYGQIQGLSTDFRYAAVNVPHIWFGGAAGANERMRLTSAGLLGIGVSPACQLHVDSGAAAEGIRINSTSDTFISLYRSNARKGYLQSATAGLLVVQEENLPLAFYTNNLERGRFSSGGNLGVGTTNPQSPIHLEAAAGAAIARWSDVTNGTLGFFGSASGLAMGAPATSVMIRAEAGLEFSGGGNARHGIFTSTGRFGVGSTSPGAALGVAGNAIFSGSTPYVAFHANQTGTDAYVQFIDASKDLQIASAHANGIVTFWAGGVTKRAEITAAGVFNYAGVEIGWKQIPRAGNSASPGTAYKGQCMAATGGVTINNSTFAAGDAFSIYNDTAASITITQGAGLTLRLAGTTTTGNRTLAARGMCTIWFNSASESVISGPGLT